MIRHGFDYCSKKDGKPNKEKYKEEKLDIPKGFLLISVKDIVIKCNKFLDTEDEFHDKASDGFCSYTCKGWPFSHCKVKTVLNFYLNYF